MAQVSSAAVATAGSPDDAMSASFASASPAKQFDWYADPLYYDIIFQEDTAVETRMLQELAQRFLVERRLASHENSQSSSPPSFTFTCLEPACGSARLMLSLLSPSFVHASHPIDWRVVGFDLSVGAIEFARQRYAEFVLQQQQRETLIQRAAQNSDRSSTNESATTAVDSSNHLNTSNSTSSTADLQSSSFSIPPFSVFLADMCDFLPAMYSTPSIPRDLKFDFAHCLVSSLKHLLDPRDVFRHFEQMHSAMSSDGIYVVALHIHTLEGVDHFDKEVVYHRDGSTDANQKAATSSTSSKSESHPDSAVHEFQTEGEPTNASGKADMQTSEQSEDDENGEDEEAVLDPNEVDDAFERQYGRNGTSFKAELITYMPDPTTMIEKMIARVQLDDSTSASLPLTSSIPSDSPVTPSSNPSTSSAASSMQSDMQLRVYTLSTLHTLLCSIAPMFRLEECYSYADIYLPEWSEEIFRLTYPYPNPTLAHLATPDCKQPKHPFIATQMRNWNRVFPVAKKIKQEWDGVDAILLALRRVDMEQK